VKRKSRGEKRRCKRREGGGRVRERKEEMGTGRIRVNFCSVVIFSQDNPCYDISRQNTDLCGVIPMIV